MAAQRPSYRDSLTQPARQDETQPATPTVDGLLPLRQLLALPQFHSDTVHPLQRQVGEVLPRGSFKNYDGLLVRGSVSFTFDETAQATIEAEIHLLTERMVIVCIVDGMLQGATPTSW